MKNYTVLISGGASGIGYELAKLFATDGHTLILVSRNESNLKKTQIELESKYSVKVFVIVADLSDLDKIPEVFLKIKEYGLVVDILVNNAGFGLLGSFTDLDIKRQNNMINLNIGALTYMTHLFLEQAPQDAKILNVASLAAFFPGPFMNVYYATKAYVLSFSAALAAELENKKITVSALCPGPVATNFWRVSQPQRVAVSKNTKKAMVSADFVARVGYKGLFRGKRIIIPGNLNKILVFINIFLPRQFVARIIMNLNK